MGRLDDMRAKAEALSDASARGRQRMQEPLVAYRPDHGGTYDVEVNRGSLNAAHLTATLNRRDREGWELDKIFEQHDNTVLVFKRR